MTEPSKPRDPSNQMHLRTGDTVVVHFGVNAGRSFVVGDEMTLRMDQIDEFLANSKEVWFTVYSPFFCLGGTSRRKQGLVWK